MVAVPFVRIGGGWGELNGKKNYTCWGPGPGGPSDPGALLNETRIFIFF